MLGALVPADINGNQLRPGDQFRVVFLSSATRDARSSDIADYDQFITNLSAALEKLTPTNIEREV
jgi:hypothetical protein